MSSPRPGAGQPPSAWPLAFALLAIVGACAVLLIVPERTFTDRYTQDLFVHLDGAWRFAGGQLPSRDFHTPLGLLAYAITGTAFALTDSLGRTMPVAMLLFLAAVAPVLFHVGRTRLPLGWALLLAVYVALLAVVPVVVGGGTDLTFAMYYNRWGWAALLLLFVLFVPVLPGRDTRGTRLLDALILGALLAAMFHIKLSYFAVGLVYVAAMAVVPRSRRTALIGIVVATLLLAAVALLWPTTGAYLADVRAAAASSGVVRDGPAGLVGKVIANQTSLFLFGIVAVIAWLRGVGWVDFLAVTFIVVASLLIANQNYEGPEIPALVAAALVLWRAPRPRPPRATAGREGEMAGVVAIVALAAGLVAVAAPMLLVHAYRASAGGGEVLDTLVARELPPHFTGVAPASVLTEVYRAGFADERQLTVLRHLTTRQEIGPHEYFLATADGVALLRRDPRLGGTVLVADLANPFSVLLRRPAPRGVYAWHHAGRSFSQGSHVNARELFRDVVVIMDPKDPTDPGARTLIWRLYGPYIRANYAPVARSDFWRAYVRRPRA